MDACADLVHLLVQYVAASATPSVVHKVLMGAGGALLEVEHLLRCSGQMAYWSQGAQGLLGALALLHTTMMRQVTTNGRVECRGR